MTDSGNTVPLFVTQGGGYATPDPQTGIMVWHSEIPDFMVGAKPGDPIPEEWDCQPVNEAATSHMYDADDYVSTSEV